MDIFRINSFGGWADGVPINNVDEVLWVERYLEAGEFTIKCEATEDLRQKLVPGTYLSHTETAEVMMVESQIIDETKDGDLRIEASGRSIEAILMENRLVTNFAYTHQNQLHEYLDDPYPSNFGDSFYSFRPSSWGHVKYLIDKYVGFSTSRDSFDTLETIIYSDIPSGRLWDPELTYYEGFAPKLSNVYTNVKELLASTNSGIKVDRNRTETEYLTHRYKFVVHQGQHKNDIVFSISAGDLESVRYLWQFEPWIRCYANSNHDGFPFPTEYPAAMYPGFPNPDNDGVYYPPGIPGGQYAVNIKSITTDAGDLTAYHNDLALVKRILNNSANLEIAKNKKSTIIDAKANKNPRYKYKIDYDIGDLVWVSGSYEESSMMRVVEHAQFFDHTGTTSLPTFAPLF